MNDITKRLAEALRELLSEQSSSLRIETLGFANARAVLERYDAQARKASGAKPVVQCGSIQGVYFFRDGSQFLELSDVMNHPKLGNCDWVSTSPIEKIETRNTIYELPKRSST